MGKKDKDEKKDDKKDKKDAGGALDPMTKVLATFRDPANAGWEDAWVGCEPTFQSEKSIKKWEKMAALGHEGEDAYFKDEYMLGTQRDVAKAIEKRYASKRKDGEPWCMFDECELEQDVDQWKVARQVLKFKWGRKGLPDFEAKWSLDPETFEWSIKPVPAAWFYDERFVRLLEELVWHVPMKHGLSPSIAHGGGQFSLSAKQFMQGSVLADDITYKLNHPELATWVMDWPNCDDRSFRATRRRFEAFDRTLAAYWAGGFHPRAKGVLTVENALFDFGFDPATDPAKGLMDPRKGPKGDAREVFQTNFGFARAVRSNAQGVHPGYWQSQGPQEDGYRPDQIMRYSEGNLNRLQIAGERHVKSGKVLDPDRVPDLDAPLEQSMLYTEASWENRAQMSKTSARDFVEAVLLDLHHAQWLAKNPGQKVVAAGGLKQDQLLLDAEATIKKHGGPGLLEGLKKAARQENHEGSGGRLKCDFVEPETLFWAAWKVLPDKERAAVAHEAVSGFVERVHAAASVDPRPTAKDDPMEWHRHRVHPFLWEALGKNGGLKDKDPVKHELEAWTSRRVEYLARRPQFSQTGKAAPWEE